MCLKSVSCLFSLFCFFFFLKRLVYHLYCINILSLFFFCVCRKANSVFFESNYNVASYFVFWVYHSVVPLPIPVSPYYFSPHLAIIQLVKYYPEFSLLRPFMVCIIIPVMDLAKKNSFRSGNANSCITVIIFLKSLPVCICAASSV